ncbi:hypothetical protein [Sansalvadorimonas verongulae]|uniref:hypothetical protein n=1 Tax=Sansalvadorimonas verongulae TaxID=2172824 RepID=UPI0012BD60CB|nr:hypothetical protein [Sansalvadorimonas verongulae]MTI12669.1 hypothetical protein [Sansalvadorimonas verongulae]
MSVYKSEPGSAGNYVVKVGGAQSHLQGLRNLVYWGYPTLACFDDFVYKEQAPASNDSLSHSMGISSYSE